MNKSKEFDPCNIILYEVLQDTHKPDRKFNLSHYLHLQITEINEYREVLNEKFGYQVEHNTALKMWITSGKANKFQKSYLKHINNCEKLAEEFEGRDIPNSLVHKVLEE